MRESTKLALLLFGGVLTAAGCASLAAAVWSAEHVKSISPAMLAIPGYLVLLLGIAVIVYGGFQRVDPPLAAIELPNNLRYPVVLQGKPDGSLSRWLWLIKWLLALPHYVVLFFLSIAFFVLTIVAFLSILVAEYYPESLFETNVGILRWWWRVGFYSYDALGTDRYPPFTLRDVDYPARLNVAYPQRLSRWLVLVKWWLLAFPQLLIVGVFGSGALWTSGPEGTHGHGPGGLLQLLVIFAAVCLLVIGRYPNDIFDFVMGLNRWVYRVFAYVALMRDEYPPFRLDLGATETPASTAR